MKHLYLFAYLIVMTGNGHVSINKLDTMEQCRMAACLTKKAGSCSSIQSCGPGGEPEYSHYSGMRQCNIATMVQSAECQE